MRCLVRFTNNTSSPVISVILDERCIFTDIISECTSPYIAVSAGTREMTVLQNNDRVYLKACISLSADNYFTVILKDDEIIVLTENTSITPHKNSS